MGGVVGAIFGGGSSGGGGGGSSGPTSGTQTVISREAPEIEARKLALYDSAKTLATQPINIPAYQVAPPSPLEQLGFGQAGTTGLGASTVNTGIGSLLSSAGAPNINQFFNPYQSYVTDEINRQSQMASNQLSANAVQAGAFGGTREGVAQAELERARLANVGQAQASGFGMAVNAAQRQQQMEQMAGQGLVGAGQVQQGMAQRDIQSLLQAGGVQRQLGQQALGAQRQTEMARAYEPYQRAEFLKGILTQLPTQASTLTQTTAPGTNPLAQGIGTGISAYAAYNMANKPQKIQMV